MVCLHTRISFADQMFVISIIIIILTMIAIIQHLQQQHFQQLMSEEEWISKRDQIFADNESERVLQFIYQLNHQYSDIYFVVFITADNFPQKFQSTLWYKLKMYDVEIQDVFADMAIINSHVSANRYTIYCTNKKDISAWSESVDGEKVYICFPIDRIV